MKPTLSLFSIFTLFSTAVISQELAWAKTIGGESTIVINAIAVDADENVYTTGTFENTADFDPNVSEFLLTAVGETDCFIQKLDADGNFLWALSFGSSGVDYGSALVIDHANRVVIGGAFSETVDFDPSDASLDLTSQGKTDIFVLRLTADGLLDLAVSTGATELDGAMAITVDEVDNIYTTGFYYYTVDFEPDLDVTEMESAGGSDSFIWKLEEDGNFGWVKSIGGSLDEKGLDIAIDVDGNVITTGYFEGNCDFSTAHPGSPAVFKTALGERDAYTLKLDAGGTLIWIRTIGSHFGDKAVAVGTDSEGAIFTLGEFQSNTNFKPGGIEYIESNGGRDIFLQKLSAGGELMWANSIGGSADDFAHSVHIDAAGNAVITGAFTGEVNFSTDDSEVLLTTTGDYDLFYQKVNPLGNLLEARQFESSGTENQNNLSTVVDSEGNLYAAGNFGEVIDLDPGDATFIGTAAGEFDGFIVKFGITSYVSLDDLTDSEALVYPVPTADGMVTLEMPEAFMNAAFSITNSVGQIIYDGTIQQFKTQLDLNFANKGIYQLIITLESGEQVVKRIVLS